MMGKAIATVTELFAVCKVWRDTYKPRCAESLLQVDSVNEALPELAEEIFNIIGYYEDPKQKKDG